MARPRAQPQVSAAQRKKNDDTKQWWMGVIVLGSLCLQCYILSVYSKFRISMAKEQRSASPRYIPTGMVHRTNAALAFSVLSWCTCFFNFYALIITKSMTTYSQQRGFMLNFFPIFWGLLTIAVATPPGYTLPNCLNLYCHMNAHIRHVWEIQLGHCVLQALYFLLFITQFPFKKPSPTLDAGDAVAPAPPPLGRIFEPMSLDDARLATVPSTLRDHINLFFVASTSPFWFMIEFIWFWTSVCIPVPPAGQLGIRIGSPVRNPHVSNEFYCWWYVTRVWGVTTVSPVGRYIVNPVKVGCFNCFWRMRYSAFTRGFNKRSRKQHEEEEISGGNVQKMAEEGRSGRKSGSVRVTSPRLQKRMELPRVSVGGSNWPVAEVENTESQQQRHEMDATPAVSEVAGSGVPTIPAPAYAPRQYHPVSVISTGSPTSHRTSGSYDISPIQTHQQYWRT